MTVRVSGIDAFRLTAADGEGLAQFYRQLGFTLEGHEAIGQEEMALLGLTGGGRRIRLRLGAQRLDLDCFEIQGKPYARDATATDLSFQHFAIVTDDAAAAWQRAARLGAAPISRGAPVHLPPSTGVAAAVKFRDPEGHPLELLQLLSPGASRWRGTGLLGIDHSAISVADASASRSFYEALGLLAHAPTVNQGSAQSALDGVPDAQVDVVPMLPQRDTPHLELLGYRHPKGRAAAPLGANDVAATRIVWAADRDELIRDPDGHLHLLRRLAGARPGRGPRPRRGPTPPAGRPD